VNIYWSYDRMLTDCSRVAGPSSLPEADSWHSLQQCVDNLFVRISILRVIFMPVRQCVD